jgi:hypothetical protein
MTSCCVLRHLCHIGAGSREPVRHRLSSPQLPSSQGQTQNSGFEVQEHFTPWTLHKFYTHTHRLITLYQKNLKPGAGDVARCYETLGSVPSTTRTQMQCSKSQNFLSTDMIPQEENPIHETLVHAQNY